MALWPVRERRRGPVDPFDALRLQLALSRLEAEIARIRADDVSFARAHKLRAATMAYDSVLLTACGLAGIAAPDRDRLDAVTRLGVEAQLAGRGWTW